MSDPRIIKKYPNRRLYDTAISSYITLGDVRQLVLDGVDFRVVDARSGEDLTRSILLQIIAEQEEGGTPVFTTDLLTRIIRFYGDSLQGVMTRYLERSMELFVEQQQTLREQMRELVSRTPVSVMAELTQRNLELWREMQEAFLQGVKPPQEGGDGTAETRDHTARSRRKGA
ncbi:polyhydroxyalkanoate synthesis repressor PhaR [Inmirania thermothiophila]|uniref:Polyhydroxyalkanoate synthesis repressor PhaR n=1 Tax=Inmirania thermothiophila TaxID=1750597 RepID=A0A3N1Y8G2_9GAMM|nr:polyhydroxyalkanoate synthesis repressor PhaR [Inmirania thermothiophila]ROR35065.1 polyhydroxyalkanoate synthesis repressor PhaR [Inmirania thermothiophila]